MNPTAGMKIYSNHWGDWLWPAHDHHAFNAITEESRMIPGVMELVRECSGDAPIEIIQAGGNAGMFPCLIASKTAKVWTFEAEWTNYRALVANVGARKANVVPVFGALTSESGGYSAVTYTPSELDNTGAGFIHPSGSETLMAPNLSIDHNFPQINPALIWLDIEGAEFLALRGLMECFARMRPTLILEMKGLGSRYNATDDAITRFLEDRDYAVASKFGRDVVWVPKSKLSMAMRVVDKW